MRDRPADHYERCDDCGFRVLAERRRASESERQAWLLRQIKPAVRVTSTALLSISGAGIGWLAGMTATGALAPMLEAQAPIQLSPGGAETILWSVVAAGSGLLVWLLKAWVDKTSATSAAHDVAISAVRERLARLEGEAHGGQGD